MIRREFISIGAAAAASTAEGMPQGIPIGFLGISHSHGLSKLRLAQESPNWRVVGVVEEESRLRSTAQAPLLKRDELLRHPEVKVIAVENLPRDHARDGLAVVEAGKHLHLEKPGGATVDDFKKILAIAKEKNLLVQTGYMWRYHPGVDRILEAVRQGWLGDIYLVKASIGNQTPLSGRAELGEFKGGVMYELGGHVIDAVVRIMGRPKRVTPFLRTDAKEGDPLADNTAAIFEWDRALGMIQSTTMQPGSGRYRSIEVHGTNGTATLRPIEPPQLEFFLAKDAGPYRSGAQTVPLPPYKRYVGDLEDLAAAVRGEHKLRVSPEEDFTSHETLLRACGMA